MRGGRGYQQQKQQQQQNMGGMHPAGEAFTRDWKGQSLVRCLSHVPKNSN
jgi:hypothetical protein